MKSLIQFTLFILLIPFSTCYAWQGKVTGVADGDTISVMHNGKAEKIRLYGIDTPEKRQAFGKKAKQFTSSMVFGKQVEVDSVTTDRYGRTVGFVYVNGKCLNEELVRSGHAWVYKQYCDKPKCNEWQRLENKARTDKIGLWSYPSPVPPWEYRHEKRRVNSRKPVRPVTTLGSYHGNTLSKVFHKQGCRHFNCKNCTAVFNSSSEAIKAGYKPCGMCRP